MKYTNGEWSVFGDPEDECPGIEADGVSIVVYGEKLADDAGVQGHAVEEAKGNANLICAAVNAARAISPANPLAAAQAMPQIVAALRAIVSVADNPGSLKLAGLDGNAFSLMGAFQRQAKKEGWSKQEIEAVLTEAKSGDYEHLVGTLADHCVSPGGDDDDDWDDDEY